MSAQMENGFVEGHQFECGFDRYHGENQQGIISTIARAQVELGVRIAASEADVGQEREDHKIIQRPCPHLASLGRNAAAKDCAGNVEAKGSITQRRTQDPATHLAEGRIANQQQCFTQGSVTVRCATSHVGNDAPAGE